MGRHQRSLTQLHAEAEDLRRRLSLELGAAVGALDAAQAAKDSARLQTIVAATAIARAGRCEAYATWSDPAWNGWLPDAYVPPELRIAEDLLNGIPLTIPMGGDAAVVLATSDVQGADHARAALRAVAFRCAASLAQGGTVHLIDPYQEGYGFAERASLRNAAALGRDATSALQAIIDAVRPDSSSRTRHHIVLAMDFPRGYSYQAVQLLNRAARLAPAGVHLIVHHDLTADQPGTHDDLDLVAPVVVTVARDGSASGPWGSFAGRLDSAPPESLVAEIGPLLGAPTHEAADSSWSALNPTDTSQWWHEDASSEVRGTIGLTADSRPVVITLGQDSAGDSRAHAVMGGQSGSGKSVMLRTLITSLAVRYPPDDLRFYLIDGQNGAGFFDYKDLPHADLVALDAPVDLVRAVLSDVETELTRRSSLLAAAGVPDITEYQRKVPGGMPRLIIVIDEYQQLLNQDVRDVTLPTLQRIAAQGRKTGVHLVLSSQRFQATGLQNQDALFANIQTRISLQLPPDSLAGVDEFEREGRRLIGEQCTAPGRIVVNDQGGRDGANVAGRVSLLTTEDHQALVESLARMAPLADPVLVNGAAQPDPGESRALRALARVDSASHEALASWATRNPRDGGLRVPSWQPYDHPFPFIVGRSLSVYGSAFATIERKANENVLLVCDEPSVLTGMIMSGLGSAGLGVTPGSLTVQILSQLPPPGSWYGVLTTDLEPLLHARGHRVTWADNDGAAVTAVDDVVGELERRAALDPVQLAACGPWIIAAAGLDRLSSFRLVDGKYESLASEATAALLRVAKEGPDLGIHLILGFTGRAAWDRVMPARSTRRFSHRFVRQMSEQDSRAILDSAFGNRVNAGQRSGQVIGPDRAGYLSMVTGNEQVFLPYLADNRLKDALATLYGTGGPL